MRPRLARNGVDGIIRNRPRPAGGPQIPRASGRPGSVGPHAERRRETARACLHRPKWPGDCGDAPFSASKDRCHAPPHPPVGRIARSQGPPLRPRAGHHADDRPECLRARPAGPHDLHGHQREQSGRHLRVRLRRDGFHRQLRRQGPVGRGLRAGHAPPRHRTGPGPRPVVHPDGDLEWVAEHRGPGGSDGYAPGPLRPGLGRDDGHHNRAGPAAPLVCLARADLPAPGGALRRQPDVRGRLRDRKTSTRCSSAVVPTRRAIPTASPP